MSHPNQLLSRTRSNYLKFKARLERSISNGTFDDLNRRRKNALISRVEKFRARLEGMSVSMKGAAVAGTVAAGAILPNTAEAQTQGMYFRKTGVAIPFPAVTRDFKAVNIDGDPELEIVIATNSGGEILNGDIDNGFTSSNPVAFDYMERNVLVGDLDGDMDMDVIFTSASDGTYIHKAINDGDGNFTASNYIGTSGTSSHVDLVDWDSDGDLDVVMTSGSNYFNVLVNTGGEFADYGTNIYLTDGNVTNLEFADLDNDGDMDLIHVGEYGVSPVYGRISVLENTAGKAAIPEFETPVIAYSESNNSFEGIEVLDMDGDGDLDIFFHEFGYGNVSRNEFQTTPFTFTDVNVDTHSSSGAISDAAVSDFDNDGDDDLILVGGGYNKLFRFDGTDLSDTNGNLASNVGDATEDFDLIGLGDLDGDGNLDLVTENSNTNYAYLDVSGPQKIVITLDNFTERRAFAATHLAALIAYDRDGNDIADTDGGTVFSFAIGDGTNDADNARFTIAGSGSTARFLVGGTDLDFESQSTYRILLAGTASGITREFEFELYLQNSAEMGQGTFDVTAAAVENAQMQSPVMADIDGDGDDDLIYKRSGGNHNIYLQTDLTQSSGAFIAYGDNVLLSDFDNDGDLDLITNNSTDVYVYLNDGAGDFSDSYGDRLGTFGATLHDIAVADFDKDGDMDLATAGSNGGEIWYNDGDRTFSYGIELPASSDEVEVGDFDRDGNVEVVFRVSNNTYIYSNSGGSFVQTSSFYNSNTRKLDVADFDGDGDLDLMIATSDNLQLLGGEGDGSFISSNTSIPYMIDGSDLAVGDVDADGTLDVAFVTNQGSGGEQVVTYLNDGSNYFDLAQNFPVSEEDEYASFRGLVLGDVDGDDDLDMVVSGGEYRQVLENTNIAPYLTGFSGRSIIDENTAIGTVLGKVSAEDPNGDAVTSISFADGENDNDLFLMDASGNITLNSELDWEELGSDLFVEIEVEDNQGNSRIESGDLKINNLAEEGHGIFDDNPIKTFGAHDARVFEPGDYDMDGDADLFRSSFSGSDNSILQQNGGSFSNEPMSGLPVGDKTAFVDFDNDGDLDVLHFANGELRIARNEEGDFSNSDLVAFFDEVEQIIVGDIDNDGLLEVVVHFENFPGKYDYIGVQTFEIDEGDFNSEQYMLMYDESNIPASLVSGDFENMSVGDFTGNGFADLLVTTSDDDDVIFPGSASGFSYSYTSAITANDYGFSYGIAGDVNGDGVDDIISIRDASSGLEKVIDIYVNNGSGSFTVNQSISGTQLTAIALGDIDGDGSVDIVTGSYEDDGDGQDNYDIDIRTNDGSGTFAQVQTISDVDADQIRLMDVDGDDDLDIVMRQAYREEENDHVLFVFKNDNVAPTAINLSSTSFDEHLPLDTEIATITIDDLNLNDTHVISLITGDGSNDLHNSFFSLNGNSLRVSKDVRFEETPQLFIYLSVYDGHQTYQQAIVLEVNNANQGPTAITLSNSSLDEEALPGTIVASVSVTDPNAEDVHDLSLAEGNGTNDAQNDLFVISQGRLILIGNVNFSETPVLNIYISADDGKESFEQALVLTVNKALGVRDEISSTLGVYPNPGSDKLAINLDNQLRGTMSVKISDLSGKVFHMFESEKNSDQWVDKLDMTNAKPGIYLVEISLGDQQFTQRWIKSK
ncbi:MAG: FG-GAP-like repeat-containing protein [Cyclobacteriaceae bacterium]